VRALFDGKVIDVGYSQSSGNYITIQSSDKIKYFICHLNESLVEKGDYVNQYDVIALSGATGNKCTGPTLHLALFINGATYDVTKLFSS
jgi:murein DD-endopeptidase MepM/ murein hydrolase activator NlpD